MRLDAAAAAAACDRDAVARRSASTSTRPPPPCIERGDREHGPGDRGDHRQPGHRSAPGDARRRRRRGGPERGRRSPAALAVPGCSFPTSAAALQRGRGAAVRPGAPSSPRICLTTTRSFDARAVNAVARRPRGACRRFAAGPGARAHATAIDFSVEARYPRAGLGDRGAAARAAYRPGRPTSSAHRRRSTRTHEEIFAIDDPDPSIEIVTWRARVRCALRASRSGAWSSRAPRDARLPHDPRTSPGSAACAPPWSRLEPRCRSTCLMRAARSWSRRSRRSSSIPERWRGASPRASLVITP